MLKQFKECKYKLNKNLYSYLVIILRDRVPTVGYGGSILKLIQFLSAGIEYIRLGTDAVYAWFLDYINSGGRKDSHHCKIFMWF